MRERKDRKSKGSHSVLDEFTSVSGVGEIIYTPNANSEVLKKIEEATRLADVPISSRSIPEKNSDFKIHDEDNLTLKSGNDQSAKQRQTDSKEIANGYQTDNKIEKEPITNRQQTDNKEITNLLPKNETDNKQVTKRITKQITIGQQTDNKQVTKSGFESLVGNEKNLLLLIFKECLRVGNLISPEITLSHIYESLKINPGVAKMVIHRLVKKEFIKREISKTGRGGWIKFSIQKELYQDLRIRETDINQITNR